MNRSNPPIRTGNGVDLAFSVVVLASYFTTFSAVKSISVSGLVVLIFLGIIYLSIGIYGYTYCAQSGSFPLQIAYFVVQILLGDLIYYLGGTTGFNAMILLPLAGHSVVLLPEFWRYAVNGAIVSTFAVAVRVMSGGWDAVWTNLPVFLAGQIFILVFTQMAVGEEKARKEIQELANELARANQQLREFAFQAEELAIAKERNRLAREIHDGIGHHLTALNMQIKAARAVLDKDGTKTEDLLRNAESLTQKALVDVRQSVSALHGSTFENLFLPEQIEEVLKECKAAGLTATLDVLGEPRILSPQATLTIYRSVQEGVNNTMKHASASRVMVTLDYTDPIKFCLTLADDGIGSDAPAGGFGLISMRERVQLLEGDINIQSSKGRGFQIEINLPG
jgi:signal transduction histidine kinase